ncbi:MAG TPA: MFS transporter [Stellaceae bacterium]|nr:MFS transporter [Stellaceae bacterium]
MNQGSVRWAIFFANIGHTLTHLMMLLYPTVVLTLEKQFTLSYGELMWLSVPGLVLYGLAALPAGWLGDRWSAEHMMVLFFSGSGVAGIATGLAQSPVQIACGLAAIGFFGAIYHPVGTAWLVRHAENRGRMLGWNGIFGSLGVGAGPIVGATLSAFYGWRAAFLVPGGIALLLGGALMLLVRGGTVVAAKSDIKPQAEPASAEVKHVFLLLSITMLSTGIIFQAFTSVLPKLFEVRLADLTAGGLVGTGGMVSLVFALSAAFQFFGGMAADRFSMKRIYLLCWVLQVPVLFTAIRLFDLPLFVAALVCFSLIAISTPTENAMLAHYTPSRWRATAFGAKFLLSLGVSALGVPLVATVYDRSGDFIWLFAILGVLAALVAATALFLPRERRSVPDAVAAAAE